MSFSSVASLFNFLGFLHQFGSFLLLASKICLTLELYLLHLLSLIELKALSEFSNRHFFHESMTTSFSRVKSLGPLNWDLLQFSDLSDELRPLGKLGGFLILTLLQAFLEFTMHFISNRFVFLLFQNDLFSGSVFIGLNLSDDIFLLVDQLLDIQFTLFHHDIHFGSHLVHEVVVLLLFVFTGQDRLFSGELHFNLFLLNVLEALDLVLLVHLSFPAVELRGILESHGHLLKLFLLLSFF